MSDIIGSSQYQPAMGPAMVKAFFMQHDLPTLVRHRQQYHKLLAEAKGEIQCHYPMPWMIPAWESGLAILNEVISEKEQANNHSHEHQTNSQQQPA